MGLIHVAGGIPLANILFTTFMNSDGVGKAIVVALIFVSIIAWCIMLAKHIELLKVERADRAFKRAFDRQENPLEIYVQGPAHADSPMAKIYSRAGLAVKREFEAQAVKQHRPLSQIDLSQEKLSALQIDAIRKVAECEAADQILLIEDQMASLGVVYTVAPLGGLLGTVWGVMVAFHGMGLHGSSNITAVAPGISSALLTTVVGLLVAIPSGIGCHKLNEKIRFLGVQMENFSEEFATRLQQSFLYE